MGKHYRYALRKDSTTYYKVVNGVVDTQTTPFYFYEGINKFSDLGISEYRNTRMNGFYRNISQTSYAFVGDMMKILKWVAFTHGVQAEATLVVERISDYQTKTYSLDYESQINFAKSSRERDQFLAEIMQAGVEELLKSREDAKYTLDVSGSGLVTINILPFRVRGRSSFVTIQAPGQPGHGDNRVAEKYNWPGYAQFKETVVEVLESPNYRPVDYFAPLSKGVSSVVEFGQFYNELGALGNFEGYALKTNIRLEKVKMNFVLPVYINNLDASPVTFRGKIYKSDLSSNFTLIDNSLNTITVAAGNSTSQSFTFDSEFAIDANMVIHIIVENTTPAVTNVEWQYEAQRILSIDFEHYTSAFQVKGLTWKEVGTRLTALNTDSLATFKSDLLTNDITYSEGIDCKPNRLALLSSKSIKGMASPDMQISMADYLKATDVMLCTGMGIERAYDLTGGITATTLRLEKKSYFYQEQKGGSENLIAELGDPASEPMQAVRFTDDMAYNEIHIGYREADTDDLNGQEEYNTTLKNQTSYTKDKNTKELVSSVSASGMAMYQKFIRYATGQDKDNGNDNDLFVLQYGMTPTAGVYSALYPTEINASISGSDILGITDKDRMLNIGLTPKRCLIRRAYWEISHFWDSDPFTDAYDFKFLTLDKNKNLVSKISSTYFIAEKTDEDLSDLLLKYGQERLFYPYYIESNHESPDNIRMLWQGNRNGVFAVNIEGNRYTGFPMELHEKNAKPKMYTFKMLLTAANNIFNLR